MDNTAQEDQAIYQAMEILKKRMHKPGMYLNNPQEVKNYLCLLMGSEEHEVFTVLYMDTQNSLITIETPFRGTLAQTSVFPREIVKRALHHNAAAVIFSHNHPSGVAQQSRADEMITSNLQQALALIDVRVLDHIIVAGASTLSFAERGLI